MNLILVNHYYSNGKVTTFSLADHYNDKVISQMAAMKIITECNKIVMQK